MISNVTLALKREALLEMIRDLASAERWQEALDAVIGAGPSFGPRKADWVAACEWHADRLKDGSPIDWIVIQGSVWLAHAHYK